MVRLDLSNQGLAVLPPILADVTELWCNGNKLISLPDLPAGLTKLDCGNNHLRALPNLPTGITLLFCDANNLTALPVLPAGLTRLICFNNQLTALPDLPAGLTELHCYNNQLTSLPDLPARLVEFSCTDNPFPPELKTIVNTYRANRNISQLIISVNYYNAEQRRRANIRQVGRTYTAIKNIGASIPNSVLGMVGHYATGTKPSYGLNQTLRNLKRNHNSYGPRKQRKSLRKKRKSNRRKTRRN